MPALIPMQNLSLRVVRAAVGVMGIFLLLLQTFGPVLASPGETVWVEICSEGGAVWVEVDLEEGAEGPTAYCPKCADCALCAVTSAAPAPDLPQMVRLGSVCAVDQRINPPLVSYSSEGLWPETRGPPQAIQETTERAPRASMAFIQVTGGAPWS